MRMRRVHLTMCTKGITAFSNRYGVVVWTGKNDTKTISVDANLIRFQTEIFLKTEQNSSVFKKISVWKRIKCGQGLNNKTECPIFPYKRVSSKKILLPWFNKKCGLNICSWNAWIVNWRLIGLTVVLAKQLYHDSFRLSRKRLFALQRRYDSWKGFKITTQQRCSAAWFTRIAHEQ